MRAFVVICVLLVLVSVGASIYIQRAYAQTNIIDVTKISVNLSKYDGSGREVYILSLQCELLIDSVVQHTFTVTKEYQSRLDLNDLAIGIRNDMQAEIDKYVDEQGIFNHAKMDQLVTYLETNLSW